jgi:hypothetical protein
MSEIIRYFAYGSNMNEEHLTQWCLERGYSPVTALKREVAVLKGWRLEFNYYSSRWGAGAANIVRDEKGEAWGILMELTEKDYEKIRCKEGYPNYYDEIIVDVLTRDGKLLTNVKTFKVVRSRESKEYTPPTREYLNLLIEAAINNNFPQYYIKFLKSLPTK